MATTNEKLQFEVNDVTVGDVRVTITGYNDEIDDGGDLVISYQKFDQDANRFVEDEATSDAASAQLEELFGVTLSELVNAADPAGLLDGKVFAGYFNSERGAIYTRERRGGGFIKPEKLDARLTKALKNAEFPLITLPMTESHAHGFSATKNESYAMYRFDVLIPLEVDGETHHIKASQLVHVDPLGEDEDITWKMNYADDSAVKKYKKVDEGEVTDPTRVANLLKVADKTMANARQRSVDAFCATFGIEDFDKEFERGLRFKVEDYEYHKSQYGNWIGAVVTPIVGDEADAANTADEFDLPF